MPQTPAPTVTRASLIAWRIYTAFWLTLIAVGLTGAIITSANQ